MSFILDALKKLEQNRNRGEVPDLTTVHLHDTERPKKKTVWPYLLLAALILNAGIITVWFRPWEEKDVISAQPDIIEAEETALDETVPDKPAETVSAKADSTIENRKAVASSPAIEKKVKVKISEPVAEPEKPVEPEEPAVKSDEEVIASIGLDPTPDELDILRNIIKEEQDITVPVPVEDISDTSEPDIPEPADSGGFIEFSQLPDDVRKDLPKIIINGHIYSDNRSARLANINGYITREGDKVTSELILDEITTAGVIFNYKEYRFRIRAF